MEKTYYLKAGEHLQTKNNDYVCMTIPALEKIKQEAQKELLGNIIENMAMSDSAYNNEDLTLSQLIEEYREIIKNHRTQLFSEDIE